MPVETRFLILEVFELQGSIFMKFGTISKSLTWLCNINEWTTLNSILVSLFPTVFISSGEIYRRWKNQRFKGLQKRYVMSIWKLKIYLALLGFFSCYRTKINGSQDYLVALCRRTNSMVKWLNLCSCSLIVRRE